MFVGTSGFAYKEWVGPFYPPGTKASGMLPHYAGEFNSVEVNYTFRRLPSASAVAGWAAQTPEDFVFALKANQRITHHARLSGVAEPLRLFLEAVTPLAGRLGPILFQCSPTLRYDPRVLDAFLIDLGRCGGGRYAMEFRHPSFDCDEVRQKLAGAEVALCVADTEETPARFVRTAGFAYLRLRRGEYDEAAISRWAHTLGEALDEETDVYVYLKHEDSAAGPANAALLRALAAP